MNNPVLAVTSVSIHALLAESDNTRGSVKMELNGFYPRSPCGERRWLRCWQLAARDVSIHALLAESDAKNTSIAGRITSFLSTLSLRRATQRT